MFIPLPQTSFFLFLDEIRHIKKKYEEKNNKKYSESEESLYLSLSIYIFFFVRSGFTERDQCLMLCPRQRDWKKEPGVDKEHGRSPIRSTAPHKSTLTDEKGRTLRTASPLVAPPS